MLIHAIRELSRRIITFWRRRIGAQIQPLLTTVRVSGLVLSAIALWLFAEIAEEVIQDETHAFDTSVLLAMQKLQQPWLTCRICMVNHVHFKFRNLARSTCFNETVTTRSLSQISFVKFFPHTVSLPPNNC
jgi:hypothetical protein